MRTASLKKTVNTRLTLAALLGCSALVVPSFADAAVPAKTSWAVSRVASASQGSYCTMAQKYADATVMTFARNIRGEYSLALDFQDSHFKEGEKQTITLRPQGGAAQTYSVTPQSDRTVVVGIGKDATMIKQIASTEGLNVEIAGNTLSYALSQFPSGQKELGNCIDALQSTKGKDAELVNSPKTGMSSPDVTVNHQVAVVNASDSNEPSIEGLLAAKPTPSVGVSALSSEEVEPVAVAPKGVSSAASKKAEAEAAALREENARLARAMNEQRQNFENQQATANGAALDELRQKLDAVKVENATLRMQLDKASSKDELAKLNDELQKANQTAQSLQAENQILKTQVTAQSATAEKANALSSDVAKANQSLEALKAENTTLRNQIQVYQSKQSDLAKNTGDAQAQLQANAAELAKLQNENVQLKGQLAAQASASSKVQGDTKETADKLASLSAELDRQKQANAAMQAENDTLKNQIQIYAKTGGAKSADAAQLAAIQKENQDLKAQIANIGTVNAQSSKADPKLQQQLAIMQTENAELKNQLAVASRITPSAASMVDEGSDKLRLEIRDLRAQIDTAQAEKATLQNQLASLQKNTDTNQIKMAGGSWDLEQATRRYQESQREIQRLGSQLQMQQAKCTKEKKDIEYMLFDPAIAKSSQIAMLNSLEDQIAEKDKKVKSLEVDLTTAKAQASPEKDQKIQDLQKQLDQTKTDMSSKLQQASTAQDKVIASLKDELSKKDKEFFDVQSQLAEAQNKAAQIDKVKASASVQEQNLASLKADLAQKTQQLADAQAKAGQVDQAKAAITTQEQTVAALKADLAQKTQQLADAQAKAGQVDQVKAAVSTQEQTVAALRAELAQKTQQLAEANSKVQQVGQAQSASAMAQEATINTLKTQLAETQTQLSQARTNAQQVDAKASADQAATLATLQMQIQQGNQKIAELQSQIGGLKTAAALAAAAPAPAAYTPPAPVAAAPVTPQPAPVLQNISFAPKAAPAKFLSIDEFSGVLKSAGVPVRGALQQVKGGDPSSYRAYSWKTDSLYGSVEMRQAPDASAFDTVIGQYLSRAKSRCAGEFAAVPSSVKAANIGQSKSYEIACVNQNASSSASVLFTYGNGIAMTVAHEGRAEAMDLAMDARDRVSGQIR